MCGQQVCAAVLRELSNVTYKLTYHFARAPNTFSKMKLATFGKHGIERLFELAKEY